jgi:hypothetical protein
MLVLDMIEILPPLGKYKYDIWRIPRMKCYNDNFVRLQSCIRNVNSGVSIMDTNMNSCNQSFTSKGIVMFRTTFLRQFMRFQLAKQFFCV